MTYMLFSNELSDVGAVISYSIHPYMLTFSPLPVLLQQGGGGDV